MKLQIELTEEQLQLIINALEVNFRLMQPQCGRIVADLIMQIPNKDKCKDRETWNRAFDRHIESRNNAEHVLDALQKIMFGDYTEHRDLDEFHRLSDMWSALRHLQYEMNPTDEWDVRSGKPIRLSDYPMIKVEVVE